ncbi:MAG: GNAT family N-acetyltransferase [Candidatus Acidiferrales bacterium]
MDGQNTERLLAAPVLVTARLRLRAHTPEDFAASAAMWADPEVTRFIGGRPFTREESWTRLLRCAGHWALMGFGYWAVEDRASGKFIGEAGFADYKRDIDPPVMDMPEAGWAFVPEAHGHGIATETARALMAWGDAHFGSRATTCLIDQGHAASIRVAEKCGYREWRRVTYHGNAEVLFLREPRGAVARS